MSLYHTYTHTYTNNNRRSPETMLHKIYCIDRDHRVCISSSVLEMVPLGTLTMFGCEPRVLSTTSMPSSAVITTRT